MGIAKSLAIFGAFWAIDWAIGHFFGPHVETWVGLIVAFALIGWYSADYADAKRRIAALEKRLRDVGL